MQLKKAFKHDKVKKITVYVPPVPTGGLFFFGKVGSGKTCAMMNIAQRYHDYRNLKVFDMWGGERNQGENLYWIIPSKFNNYWKFWEKRLRLDENGAKQYRVNLLYPLFRSLPKKLPELEEYVFPIVFRIPFKTITKENISCVLGNLSEANKTIWDSVLNTLKNSDGPEKLIKFFQKNNYTNTSLYKDFVKPLFEEGLLCSMEDKLVLNIGKEMKDKETISVFVHHYIPKKFDVFILDWFFLRIWELGNEGKVPKDIIPIIREASKFFRASDRSVLEEKYKIFKKHLVDSLRFSRGRLHPLLDTQSPEETKGFLDGNQDFSVIGLLPGRDDRQFATEQFKRDGSMVTSQIKELAELDPGDYYFVEGKGKLARKRHLILPRTMYWRERDNPFYKIWEDLHGRNAFFDSSKIYKNVKKIQNENLRELNSIEKEKKKQKKREQEEKKRIEEKRQEEEKLQRKLELYEKEKLEKEKIRKKIKEEKKRNKNIKDLEQTSEEEKEQDYKEVDLDKIFNDL